jgi:hypothetical protein
MGRSSVLAGADGADHTGTMMLVIALGAPIWGE